MVLLQKYLPTMRAHVRVRLMMLFVVAFDGIGPESRDLFAMLTVQEQVRFARMIVRRIGARSTCEVASVVALSAGYVAMSLEPGSYVG